MSEESKSSVQQKILGGLVAAALVGIGFAAKEAIKQNSNQASATAPTARTAASIEGRWKCGGVIVSYAGQTITEEMDVQQGHVVISGNFDFLNGQWRQQLTTSRTIFGDNLSKAYAVRAASNNGDPMGAARILQTGYVDEPLNDLTVSKILTLDDNNLVYQFITEYRDGIERPKAGTVSCQRLSNG